MAAAKACRGIWAVIDSPRFNSLFLLSLISLF